MRAVAQAHVGSRTVAADVVQETWTVGLVVDTVKARGSLSSVSLRAAEAAVDPERVRGPGDRYPGASSLTSDKTRMTIEAVGRIGEEEVPPEMRDELVAAFRDFKRMV